MFCRQLHLAEAGRNVPDKNDMRGCGQGDVSTPRGCGCGTAVSLIVLQLLPDDKVAVGQCPDDPW